MAAPPSDEELFEFARSILGSTGAQLAETDDLRETVTQALELWRELYEISRADED